MQRHPQPGSRKWPINRSSWSIATRLPPQAGHRLSRHPACRRLSHCPRLNGASALSSPLSGGVLLRWMRRCRRLARNYEHLSDTLAEPYLVAIVTLTLPGLIGLMAYL